MGWGEERVVLRRDRAAMHLAEAVRAWRDHPTTGNAEKLSEALDRYDAAADPPEVTVHISEPERVRFVAVPVERETGMRTGW